MLPGAFDLEIYRGDTARWEFALWQDAAKTIPVDLAGVIAATQIRATPDSETVLVTIDCLVGPPNLIAIGISAAHTASLPGQSYWDLQLTYPGGDIQTILAGVVFAMPDVTRLAAE